MSPEAALLRSGYAVLGVGVLCLAAMFLDTREVMGVNTWLKPLKFCLSVGVFLVTLGMLMPHLASPEWMRKTIGYGLPLTIGTAWGLVVLQGARGVKSHYNNSTPFDATVFGLMGLTITASTFLLVWMLVEFFRHPAAGLGSAFLWGIRLGLLSAVLGSVQGSAMIRRNAHTVGAPDGGPGLPVMNFSTVAGDLRIAHAVALHGLQVLPLAGWWLANAQVPRGALLVWLLFAADMGLFVVTHLQALSAKPLIAGVRRHDT